jgi:hypothetical protein
MATKGRSNPERIARWKVMTAGLGPRLGDLPLLTDLHTELVSIILQSEDLDVRHEALKAETREINRVRDDLATRGDELRSRLAATLQTVYGFRSEKLIEFGIQPRRVRGRDRQQRKPRAQPEPTPAPEAASATNTE